MKEQGVAPVETTVAALTGEYKVHHPPGIDADALVRCLEEGGALPQRCVAAGRGAALLQLGMGGYNVRIDGVLHQVMIFQRMIGVGPVPDGGDGGS